MPLILNSLIQAVINSAILFIVYGYLYFQEKRKYLRVWTLGWFLQFFRFLFEIWLLYNNSSILSFCIHTLNLLSAYMMVHGTYTFINKKTPQGFGYLVVLNLLWFPVAYFINAPFYLEVLPIFLLTGIIYLGTGIAFIKTIDTTGIAKYITGVTFILWGIHKANYPFLKPIPETAYWGFLVTSVFEITAALGILLVHFEKAKQIEQIAKEDLRQQHERFRVTLESIGDGVITTDVEGLVGYLNPVARELTGYSESEAVGRHISHVFKIINEYTGEPAEIPIEKVIREGIVKGLANHTALIQKDGSMVSIADSAAPIRNNIGEIVGVVMVFRDITQEREVEKSREQLAFIVESSHEAIFSIDLDYNIKSWNQGAEKIYGYKAQEILGKSAYILASSERHHELDEYTSKALHEKSPIHYETVRLRKDGSKVDLMISISPVIDDYDNILGISVIAHDISDRIRSREMLKRYKMLSDSTTDVILFVGYPDGRIIEANQAAIEAFGYDAQELLSLTIHDLRDESDIEDIGIQLEKALKGIRFETIHRRKDGSTFPVEVNSIGGVLEGQQVLLSICRDITERKRFEEQLKYLSRHDHLTGLYNRMVFDEKLIQLEKNPPYPFAVVICDIDGLKMINDTFGHEAGDRFIKAAANNIKKAVRKQDFLARTAGDEFAIIMPHADKDIAEKTIEKIRQATKKCKEHRLPIPLYVSIGYAIVDDENTLIKEAQKTAENNMYREKLHHGRSKKSSIIKTLVKMLEARDIITQGHSHRTEKLAVKLAQMMNMNQRQIDDIKLLAIFHDIGKVGVPDNILFKKGPLTYEERLKMQRHTEIGHRIAVSSPELAHISDWILLHHEWWDGNGYPLGIKGEEIPLECRILAIVDAYDAMTKNRPYRSAMTHEEAMAELKRCAGTQFDPSLVELFLKILEDEAETA
jgi:diguanylate cyclase (GGDEF)-like protein/PAS domain S-box-containing protein